MFWFPVKPARRGFYGLILESSGNPGEFREHFAVVGVVPVFLCICDREPLAVPDIEGQTSWSASPATRTAGEAGERRVRMRCIAAGMTAGKRRLTGFEGFLGKTRSQDHR